MNEGVCSAGLHPHFFLLYVKSPAVVQKGLRVYSCAVDVAYSIQLRWMCVSGSGCFQWWRKSSRAQPVSLSEVINLLGRFINEIEERGLAVRWVGYRREPNKERGGTYWSVIKEVRTWHFASSALFPPQHLQILYRCCSIIVIKEGDCNSAHIWVHFL